MQLLGVDYGRKRIGLATCGILKIAHPLKVIHRFTIEQDLKEIGKVIEQYEITEIVVGLPKNMNNSHGEMAQEATQFANLLQEHFQLPTTLWDERLTSWQAENLLRETGLSRKKRTANKDAAAAALILQCYVERKT